MASYVRYPFPRHAAGARRGLAGAASTIVIGEDLGVVPPGFREAMRDCEIQSYRVFFFEKRGDEFYTPPENYPREALACVSLHDLHTLAGWWSGHDIEVRQKIGMLADTRISRRRGASRASASPGARAARREGADAGGDGAGAARRGSAARAAGEPGGGVPPADRPHALAPASWCRPRS